MSVTPQKIGKYKILSALAEGGMGAIYKAEHPTLLRTVIVKKLTIIDNEDFAARFKREASILMDLRHENIVQVYDHFKERNSYYIVMEYVNGINLEDLIKEKRFLSNEIALVIINEIAKALKYAHDKNVIHRDIKPANILISHEGEVKLVDFGVASSLESSDEDGLTRAGMTIGTPSYLAPEQISNANNRDKRADVYSLGVVLYEMVVGKKPFRGGFSPELITQIQKGKYTKPRKINPKISSFIQRIIKKAMHHKAKSRYQDLGYMIAVMAKQLGKNTSQEFTQGLIKDYLIGKEQDLAQNKKNKKKSYESKFLNILTSVLLVFALAGLAGYWGYHKGLHYQYLYPEKYGALRFEFKVRKNYRELKDNFFSVKIFKENKDRLTNISDLQIDLEEDKTGSNKKFSLVKSQKIYLPEGNYTALFYIQNEQYRENFYLSPLNIQRDKFGKERIIRFSPAKKTIRLPLTLNYEVRDIETGRSLKEETTVSIFKNKRWINLDEFLADEKLKSGFTSGRRYSLRFNVHGYYSKLYEPVTVRTEQNKLNLSVQLTPIPGSILVNTSSPELKIYLNNSDSYLVGGRKKHYQKLPDFSKAKQKLLLSPGEYYLTAKKSGLLEDISTTEKIKVEAGKIVKLSVTYDQKNETIKFNKK